MVQARRSGVLSRLGWASFAIACATCASACAERPRFSLGTDCELTTECAPPFVCRLGRCREECRDARDCRVGLVCFRDESGLGACELSGEVCTTSLECEAPLVCREGRCANACETDVDCPPGHRCQDALEGGRGCVDDAMSECSYDSECESWQRCTPDDRCREQCVLDRDCRDGTVCVGMAGMRVCDFPRADGGASDDAGSPSDTGPPSDTGSPSDTGPLDAAGIDGGMSVGPAPAPTLVLGERHSCAVLGAETRCWGDDASGQLGNGAAGASATPVAIPTLAGATVLAAGSFHACAVLAAGLRCWGRNASGQVGDGSTTMRTSPVAVTGAGTPTWLAAAADHTCALSAGDVYCWGANGSGQLGDGTTTPRPSPVRAMGLAASAVEVSTRSATTCARLGDGRVQCWGDNRFGQLGATSPSMSTSPLTIDVSGAVEIATGSSFACARLVDGSVQCWGGNGQGQLGDGTRTSRPTPAPVAGLSMAALELAVGADHACARLVDGSVHCWGANLFGQSGSDPFAFMGTELLRPRAVAGVSGASEIAAGDSHSCARTSSGLRCWGANDDGQLGDGTMVESWMPVPVSGT